MAASAADPALAAPTRVDVLDEFVAAYGAALIGCTVVRIRGYAQVLTAANVGVAGVLTAFIGDANDIERGPNANDNFFDSNSTGKDYFMVESFFHPSAAQDVRTTPTDWQGRAIDVKASRKLEEVSQRLVIDYSCASSAAVAQSILQVQLSILLMLP